MHFRPSRIHLTSVLFVLGAAIALPQPGPAAAAPSPPPVIDSPARAVSASTLAPGTTAPAFSLADLAGRSYDLSPLLGKNSVVLSFWSIYCDSCVKEMLSLQKLEDKYQGKGLTILAVNEDFRVPRERIVRFLDRLSQFRGKITYPVLFDKDSAVFDLYCGNSLPTTILIGKDGKVFSSYQGFSPESEAALLEEIEGVIAGRAVAPARAPVRITTITVTGRGSLTGFFDKSGWRRNFSGGTNAEQETAAARETARRDAQRLSVQKALEVLDIRLYANEPKRDAVDGRGIHVDRDPLDTDDPLSKLISDLRYARFFDVMEEQEKTIGLDLYLSRTVRVNLDELQAELEMMGFLTQPIRINFTYVNMSQLDQKEFIAGLLSQSRFIGMVEEPVFTPATASQAFEIYAPTEGFATEIARMDFGKMKVFVEDVTPGSLELEVWK
jgi:peroxiredoxin